jgi:hypothetical protein
MTTQTSRFGTTSNRAPSGGNRNFFFLDTQHH